MASRHNQDELDAFHNMRVLSLYNISIFAHANSACPGQPAKCADWPGHSLFAHLKNVSSILTGSEIWKQTINILHLIIAFSDKIIFVDKKLL